MVNLKEVITPKTLYIYSYIVSHFDWRWEENETCTSSFMQTPTSIQFAHKWEHNVPVSPNSTVPRLGSYLQHVHEWMLMELTWRVDESKLVFVRDCCLYRCFQTLWVCIQMYDKIKKPAHHRETKWSWNNCTVYISLSAWLHRYAVVGVNREKERQKSLSLCPCSKWGSLVPRQQECPGNWVLKLSKILHDIIEGDQFTACLGDTLSHTLSHTHTHK